MSKKIVAIALISMVASLLAPGDIGKMLLWGLAMYVLYELALFLYGRFMNWYRDE